MRLTIALIVLVIVFGCRSPLQRKYIQGFVFVPEAQAVIIKKQVEEIVDRDWGTLDPWDRLHGHLMLKPEGQLPKRFRSLGHLFENAVVYLYHSDEGLYRWRLTDGDLPTDVKTPRSIVVYPDGKIVAAKTLLSNPVSDAPDYEWYGSIKSRDLAKALPQTFAQAYDWEVDLPQGTCLANLQFDITLAQPGNPYFEIGSKRYKVTMDCYPPS